MTGERGGGRFLRRPPVPELCTTSPCPCIGRLASAAKSLSEPRPAWRVARGRLSAFPPRPSYCVNGGAADLEAFWLTGDSLVPKDKVGSPTAGAYSLTWQSIRVPSLPHVPLGYGWKRDTNGGTHTHTDTGIFVRADGTAPVCTSYALLSSSTARTRARARVRMIDEACCNGSLLRLPEKGAASKGKSGAPREKAPKPRQPPARESFHSSSATLAFLGRNKQSRLPALLGFGSFGLPRETLAAPAKDSSRNRHGGGPYEPRFQGYRPLNYN